MEQIPIILKSADHYIEKKLKETNQSSSILIKFTSRLSKSFDLCSEQRKMKKKQKPRNKKLKYKRKKITILVIHIITVKLGS